MSDRSAVVQIAGKQVRVHENDVIKVPLLADEVGSSVEFDQVLLVSDDDGPAMVMSRTSGHLDAISSELEAIVPMDAMFDKRWVSRLDGVRVKQIPNKWDQAMALIDDIANFKEENDCDRLVMVWCVSTEAYQEPSEVHASVTASKSREGLVTRSMMLPHSPLSTWTGVMSRNR